MSEAEDHMIERFLEKVWPEPNTGCWLWSACAGSRGYGMFQVSSTVTRLAHRISYQLFCGEIPIGLTLDHLCRTRICVNPEHLEPVTRGVNVLRGIGVTAMNAKKTHCLRDHEFTEKNTIIIWSKGRPTRHCRICLREHTRRYRTKARVRIEKVVENGL